MTNRHTSDIPVINSAVWKAACSSIKAREKLMDARVRALYRDTEFWGALVNQSCHGMFVDRLHAAVLNLIRHSTLNETWLQDAYTAQSVVSTIADDTVGGLFKPLMDKLTDMIGQAEQDAID